MLSLLRLSYNMIASIITTIIAPPMKSMLLPPVSP